MKAGQRRIVFLCVLVLVLLAILLSLTGIDLAADAPSRGRDSSTISLPDHVAFSLSDSAQITITTAGFDPAVLTVTVGTGVTWTNATGVTHVLHSGAPWRIFLPGVLKDTGGASGLVGRAAVTIPRIMPLTLMSAEPFSVTLSPGETFTHTFTSCGDHPYFLATAPQFSGRVVVLSGSESPTASIAAPRDGTWITAGETGTFTGEATDPEDGPLSGASLVWTSGRDGQIGTGGTFTGTLTSTGVHTITLTATDSDGLTGVARIGVRTLTPGITGGPSLLTVLADSDLDAITGVAVNGAETLAYVTTDGGTELQRVDIDPLYPTFGQVTVVADTGLTDLQMGIALNPAETWAYVLEGVGELSRVDLSTGQVTLVASGLQNPHGLALGAAGSVAYVTEGDRLSRVAIATGAISTVASGLSSPHGVALSVDGTQAYVAESPAGRVSAVDLTSGAVTALATGFSQPVGVAVDGDGMDAYVTTYDGGALSRISLTSGQVTLVNGSLGGPYGLAISSDESLAYVAEQNRGQLTAVYLGESPVIVIVPGESDLQNSAGSVLNGAGTLDGARGLAVGGGDTIAYVVAEFSGRLSRVDIDPTSLTFGAVATVTGDLFILNNVTINQAETLAYVTREAGPGSPPAGQNVVTRVDLVTGAPVTVTDQLGQPTNISLSQDETEGYVADRQQEGLYRVNLSTGAITPVVTGLANTFALAVNQAETLAYVTTSEFHPSSPPPGELLRVNLVTSQVVTVATGLVSPAGLCLNADETLAYVTEFGPEGKCGGALSTVDVDPGSPTYGTVTRLLTGLCGPHDVQLNAAESVAYVVEVDGRRLIAID